MQSTAPVSPNGTVAEIIAADRAFSRMSEKQGAGPAFIAYSHPEVRIFLRGEEPLVGKAAVIRTFGSADQKKADASGQTLTWDPSEGFMSADGTLGWTDGHWAYKSAPNKDGRRDTLATGHYVTIWKRDPADGQWKMVGDIGTKDNPQPPAVP